MPTQIFQSMLGRIITKIKGVKGDEDMMFMAEGKEFHFYHFQDCCERVDIEDITGDLDDLIGSPLLQAEEVSNQLEPYTPTDHYGNGSYTWTFYKFATIKGSVTVRWLGQSNGYYAENAMYRELDIATDGKSSLVV